MLCTLLEPHLMTVVDNELTSLADIDNTSTVCQHRPPTVSVVDLNQLREPLLTD